MTERITARVYAGHSVRLPGHLDENGKRTVVEPYVPARLLPAGLDDDGNTLWLIPADAFPPGARISTPPLPPGDRLVTAIPRPNQ